jgi:hypothetical protein
LKILFRCNFYQTFKTLKLLIQDALDALLDKGNTRAFVYLNLSAQHAGLQLSDKILNINPYSTNLTTTTANTISGVSGSFVPYLDIYTFDSKNMSLGKIVNSTISNLRPQENFVVYESRPEVISRNLSSHVLLYDTIV